MSQPRTVTAAFNAAPAASNQSVSVTYNTANNVTLAALDPDGDTLTYAILSGPLNGSVRDRKSVV